MCIYVDDVCMALVEAYGCMVVYVYVCVYPGYLMYMCRTRGSDIDSCLVLPGCEGRALQRTKLRVVRSPYSGVCTPAGMTDGGTSRDPRHSFASVTRYFMCHGHLSI